MAQIDIRNDTTKYITLLLELFEDLYGDCKETHFLQILMREACRFLSEFLPIYVNAIHRENTHRIVYLYTQMAIERVSNSTMFLSPLLVAFHEII